VTAQDAPWGCAGAGLGLSFGGPWPWMQEWSGCGRLADRCH